MLAILTRDTEHRDPGVGLGRIRSDVRKIKIERDDRPLLRGANGCDVRIGTPHERLVSYGSGVVPRGTKELAERERQVFIRLEAHQALRGNGTMRSRASSAA